MKRKFKQVWPMQQFPNISTKQTIAFHLKPLNIKKLKRPPYVLKIQVLVWDRHKKVAVLNWNIELQQKKGYQ
jgi:hypothetical protein